MFEFLNVYKCIMRHPRDVVEALGHKTHLCFLCMLFSWPEGDFIGNLILCPCTFSVTCHMMLGGEFLFVAPYQCSETFGLEHIGV